MKPALVCWSCWVCIDMEERVGALWHVSLPTRRNAMTPKVAVALADIRKPLACCFALSAAIPAYESHQGGDGPARRATRLAGADRRVNKGRAGQPRSGNPATAVGTGAAAESRTEPRFISVADRAGRRSRYWRPGYRLAD